MSRRTITIIVVVLILAALGYLAHTFDLLGLVKSLHGGAAKPH